MPASSSLASKTNLGFFVEESCSIQVEAGESYVIPEGTDVDTKTPHTVTYLLDTRKLSFTGSGLVTFSIRPSNQESDRTKSIPGSITSTRAVSAVSPRADPDANQGKDGATIEKETFDYEDGQQSQHVMIYFKQDDGNDQPWAVELSRMPNVDYVWTVSFRHYGSEHSKVRLPSMGPWTGGKTESSEQLIYPGYSVSNAEREGHFKGKMRQKIGDLFYLRQKIKDHGLLWSKWDAIVNNLVDQLWLSYNDPK